MANEKITMEFQLKADDALEKANAFAKVVNKMTEDVDNFKVAYNDAATHLKKGNKGIAAEASIMIRQSGKAFAKAEEDGRNYRGEIATLAKTTSDLSKEQERINRMWVEGGVASQKLSAARQDMAKINLQNSDALLATMGVLQRYATALDTVYENAGELYEMEERAIKIQEKKGDSIVKEITAIDKLEAKYVQGAATQQKIATMTQEVLRLSVAKNMSLAETTKLIDENTRAINDNAKSGGTKKKSTGKGEAEILHAVRMEYDKNYAIMTKMAAVEEKLKVAVDHKIMTQEKANAILKEYNTTLKASTDSTSKDAAEQRKKIQTLDNLHSKYSEVAKKAQYLSRTEEELTSLVNAGRMSQEEADKKLKELTASYGNVSKAIKGAASAMAEYDKNRIASVNAHNREVENLDKLKAKYIATYDTKLKLKTLESELLTLYRKGKITQEERLSILQRETDAINSQAKAKADKVAAEKLSSGSVNRESKAMDNLRAKYIEGVAAEQKYARVKEELLALYKAGDISRRRMVELLKLEKVAISESNNLMTHQGRLWKEQKDSMDRASEAKRRKVSADEAEKNALDQLYAKYNKEQDIKLRLKVLENDLIILSKKKGVSDREIIAIRERETAVIRASVAEKKKELSVTAELRAAMSGEKAILSEILAKYDEAFSKKRRLQIVELELNALVKAGTINQTRRNELYHQQEKLINQVVTAKQREKKATERVNKATSRQVEFLMHNVVSLKSLYRASSEMVGHYTKMTSAVLIATTAVAGLAASFKSMTLIYSDFLSFRNALSVSTVDLEDLDSGFNMKEANKQMRWAIDLSIRHALSTRALVHDYSKFSAAAKLSGATMKTVNTTFENFSRAARIMGMDGRRTTNMFLALQQMFSKGKVSAEELRRQLGEYLPGAFQIAAHSMGITGDSLGEITSKFDKLVSTGKVLTLDFMPKFSKMIGDIFGKQLLAEALKKPVAAVERFTGAWDIFMANVGEKIAPLFVKITNSLTQMIYAMNSFFTDKNGRGLGFVEDGEDVQVLKREYLELIELVNDPTADTSNLSVKLEELASRSRELKEEQIQVASSTDKLKDKNKELNNTIENQIPTLSSAAMKFLGISEAQAEGIKTTEGLKKAIDDLGGSANTLMTIVGSFGVLLGSGLLLNSFRWLVSKSGIPAVLKLLLKFGKSLLGIGTIIKASSKITEIVSPKLFVGPVKKVGLFTKSLNLLYKVINKTKLALLGLFIKIGGLPGLFVAGAAAVGILLYKLMTWNDVTKKAIGLQKNLTQRLYINKEELKILSNEYEAIAKLEGLSVLHKHFDNVSRSVKNLNKNVEDAKQDIINMQDKISTPGFKMDEYLKLIRVFTELTTGASNVSASLKVMEESVATSNIAFGKKYQNALSLAFPDKKDTYEDLKNYNTATKTFLEKFRLEINKNAKGEKINSLLPPLTSEEYNRAFERFQKNLEGARRNILGIEDPFKKLRAAQKEFTDAQNDVNDAVKLNGKATRDQSLRLYEAEKALQKANGTTEKQARLTAYLSAEKTKARTAQTAYNKTMKESIRLEKMLKSSGDTAIKNIQSAETEFNSGRLFAGLENRKELYIQLTEQLAKQSKEYKKHEVNLKRSSKAQETYNKLLENLEKKYNPVITAQRIFVKSIGELDVLMVAGRISAERYALEISKAKREFIEATSAADGLYFTVADLNIKLLEFSDDFGKNFNSLFSDVFAGTENDFESFAERIERSFTDMLANMTYEASVKPIIVLMQQKMNDFLSPDSISGINAAMPSTPSSSVAGSVSLAEKMDEIIKEAKSGNKILKTVNDNGISATESTDELVKTSKNREKILQVVGDNGISTVGKTDKLINATKNNSKIMQVVGDNNASALDKLPSNIARLNSICECFDQLSNVRSKTNAPKIKTTQLEMPIVSEETKIVIPDVNISTLTPEPTTNLNEVTDSIDSLVSIAKSSEFTTEKGISETGNYFNSLINETKRSNVTKIVQGEINVTPETKSIPDGSVLILASALSGALHENTTALNDHGDKNSNLASQLQNWSIDVNSELASELHDYAEDLPIITKEDFFKNTKKLDFEPFNNKLTKVTNETIKSLDGAKVPKFNQKGIGKAENSLIKKLESVEALEFDQIKVDKSVESLLSKIGKIDLNKLTDKRISSAAENLADKYDEASSMDFHSDEIGIVTERYTGNLENVDLPDFNVNEINNATDSVTSKFLDFDISDVSGKEINEAYDSLAFDLNRTVTPDFSDYNIVNSIGNFTDSIVDSGKDLSKEVDKVNFKEDLISEASEGYFEDVNGIRFPYFYAGEIATATNYFVTALYNKSSEINGISVPSSINADTNIPAIGQTSTSSLTSMAKSVDISKLIGGSSTSIPSTATTGITNFQGTSSIVNSNITLDAATVSNAQFTGSITPPTDFAATASYTNATASLTPSYGIDQFASEAVTAIGPALSAYSYSKMTGSPVLGGVMAAGQVGLMGGLSAIGSTGFMAGATTALAAIPVWGWAAIAAMAILGGRGSKSDFTPDVNVWQDNEKSSRILSQDTEDGETDINFIAGGRYGSFGVSTQHDLFGSQEDATEYFNYVSKKLEALDEAIFMAVDKETNDAIERAMGGNWLDLTKYEEGSGENIEDVMRKRYDRMFDSMNNSLENAYENLRGIGADYADSVTGAIVYDNSTDEIKDLFDSLWRDISRIEDVSEEGETFVSTSIRMTAQLQAMNFYMEAFGSELYSLSEISAYSVNELAKVAGGFDKLAAKLDFFYSNFFTVEEQFALRMNRSKDAIAEFSDKWDIGFLSPSSLRNMITSMKPVTDEEIKLYDALLNIAPAVADYYGALDELAIKQAESAEETRKLTEQQNEYLAAQKQAAYETRVILDDLFWTLTGQDSEIGKHERNISNLIKKYGLSSDAADVTSTELAHFALSLDATDESIQKATPDLVSFAESILYLEEVSEEAKNSLNEMSTRLSGETDLMSHVNNIDEINKKYGVLGESANYTSKDLLKFIDSLDSSDNAVINAIPDLDSLTDSLLFLEQASEAARVSLDEVISRLSGDTNLTSHINNIDRLNEKYGVSGVAARYTSKELLKLVKGLDTSDAAVISLIPDLESLTDSLLFLEEAAKEASQGASDSINKILYGNEDAQIGMWQTQIDMLETMKGLQSETSDAAKEAYDSDMERYSAAIAANETIMDFLDSLKISDLNNQSPFQQMKEAAKLFDTAVSENNAEDATKYAQDYLGFAQDYYVSTNDYSKIFDSVKGSLEGMIVDAGIEPIEPLSSSSSNDSGIDSQISALNELIEKRQEEIELSNEMVKLLGELVVLGQFAQSKGLYYWTGIQDKLVEMGTTLTAIMVATKTGTAATAAEMNLTRTDIIAGLWYLGEDITKADAALGLSVYKWTENFARDMATMQADTWAMILKLAGSVAALIKLTGQSAQSIGASIYSNENVPNVQSTGIFNTATPNEATNIGVGAVLQGANQGDSIYTIGAGILETPPSWYDVSTFAISQGLTLEDVYKYGTIHGFADASNLSLTTEDANKAILNTIVYGVDNKLSFTDIANDLLGFGVDSGYVQSFATNYLMDDGLSVTDAQSVVTGYGDLYGYAKGTSYVPEDMIAKIHQGEMIIDPETSKQLRDYGIQVNNVQDNEEIVEELRELKEELRRIKEINAYGFRRSVESSDRIANTAEKANERERLNE